MKLIIEQQGTQNKRYKPMVGKDVKAWTATCYSLAVNEQELFEVQECSRYVELDFEIVLGEETIPPVRGMGGKSFVLAYIGKRQNQPFIDAYYNLIEQTFCRGEPKRKQESTYWISCFSEKNTILATDYIACIAHLIEEATKRRAALIIYANIQARDIYFNYRSLTYKIVNGLLASVEACLIRKAPKSEVYRYYASSTHSFESYIDDTLYLEEPFVQVIKKVARLMERSCSKMTYKKIYHRQQEIEYLYNDVFYKSIPEEEQIYVLLKFNINKTKEYFMNLGFKVITSTNNRWLLRGNRKQFDNQVEFIKSSVEGQFILPILIQGRFEESIYLGGDTLKEISGSTIPYKGSGVYIGIISTGCIDYTMPGLLRKNGKTRIKHLWIQCEGEDGESYDEEAINSALQNESNEEVSLDRGIAEEALWIAGGMDKNGEGIATEAEYIVAKVNKASTNLQRIYSGEYTESAALFPEVLIGVNKLKEIAKQDKKPLVLILPFNTNLSAHDGGNPYEVALRDMSLEEGCTFVTGTGEEADKSHHSTFLKLEAGTQSVQLQVKKEGQNILGFIAQKYMTPIKVKLYAPNEVLPIAYLENSGITSYNEVTIYTRGLQGDFMSGGNTILWRIENIRQGNWRIEVTVEEEYKNTVDLWISNEEANPYVTLCPSNVFVTSGSIANIYSFISVGGYNLQNQVVLKTSGRGYSCDEGVVPIGTSQGVIYRAGENTEGTLVSASIMAGLIALIYDKWQQELEAPLPNGLIIKNIIIPAMDRLAEVVYPNPCTGYGFLSCEGVAKLLSNPFL